MLSKMKVENKRKLPVPNLAPEPEEKEETSQLTELQKKGYEPIKGEDGILRDKDGNFWNEFNQLRYENLELKRKLQEFEDYQKLELKRKFQEFEDYQKLEHQSTREDIRGALVIIREIKALIRGEA